MGISILEKKRRTFGEHFTPIEIFEEFILPEIKNVLWDYVWVDLFAGEGNLILPILKIIPEYLRVEFFKNHIYLFDIQEEIIEKARLNSLKYGIPREIAEKNIKKMDTIENFPTFLLNLKYPIFHITNPPYLYIGYIVKNDNAKSYLKYFSGTNKGYQDLYQLGLMNDLRNDIKKMIYIIPSNFLFGSSVSNKIRDDFFKYYTIKKAIIFEKEIFKYTGTNVVICFFERKSEYNHNKIVFNGIKINKERKEKKYVLKPDNHYRAGNEFEEFVKKYKSERPLKIKYYLDIDEINKNRGNYKLEAIDANAFDGKEYIRKTIYVDYRTYKKITSNILFVRTVDTGSLDGRAGIYTIIETYNADAILVTKVRYRTHPIQIFIEPQLSFKEQVLLKNYFNLILEYFREKTDSEFLTTYKYSNSEYTRKYLGLSQVKEIIKTFPILTLSEKEKKYFENLIEQKEVEELISFIKFKNGKANLTLWD